MNQFISRFTSLFVGLLCLGWLVGCGGTAVSEPPAPAATPPPQEEITVDVTPQKPDDVIALRVEENTAVLDITSLTGIGGITAVFPHASPQQVVLHLHLKGLEQLRITYGDTTITAAVSHEDGSSRQSVTDSAVSEQPIDSSSPHWLNIQLVAPSDEAGTSYFAVVLPAHFFTAGQTSFTTEWIDFFR